MKIIQILTEGNVIPIELVLSPSQALQLQQERNPVLIKKLVVEIALEKRNVRRISAAVSIHKSYEISSVGFRVAEENLAQHALTISYADEELLAAGDVVFVPFRLVQGHLQFNFASLGFEEDQHGQLQLERRTGQPPKK
jgi:hypothetical protein